MASELAWLHLLAETFLTDVEQREEQSLARNLQYNI